MSSIAGEIAVIVALALLNGVFALSEIAVVSSRKARLQEMHNRGNARAKAALALANRPEAFLSTVQIGITLIGIFAGAYGGVTLSKYLAAYLGNVSGLQLYSSQISFFIIVIAITYLNLVIGELVPKRIALNNPEVFACWISPTMTVLSKFGAPLVSVLSASSSVVMKALRIKTSASPPVSEEEIRILINQGAETGILDEVEQDILERVFRLGDKRVSTLMTPRTEVVWLDIEDPIEVNLQKIEKSNHSIYPLCKGSSDKVIGMVSVKMISAQKIRGEEIRLPECAAPPVFVPETLPALRILERFKQSGIHCAMVTDEYGGISGLVTMYDILEAMVGDITSVELDGEASVVYREDGSMLIDGLIAIDDLKEALDVDTIEGEDSGDFETLGGFVVKQIGRIPVAGDHFVWGPFEFEVMDMDGHRVDKILVTRREVEDTN